MRRTDFNQGWSCRPLSRDGEAVAVTLPHDAMRTERRVPESMGEANIGWFEGGDYEYTKTFTLPEGVSGRHAMLEFEGVYHDAEIWLNGAKLYTRPYGYTNFYFPLDDALEGDNEIKVIAHNADQPNSRWYSGTGIYRPVWLWTGDGIRINGLKIRTLSIDPPTIEARVQTVRPGAVKLEILDGQKHLYAGEVPTDDAEDTAIFRVELPQAGLWSPESPRLYTARASFQGDVEETRFGIRTLTWSPDKGIALNGQRVVLRGACIHHDNGVLGACTYPEVEARRVRLLREAGYNAVRSAHNPVSKYLLDACDAQGMLMMDEYVDCWYMHKTQFDYASHVEEWWKRDMADMVDKDYNHPCVIMYSTGNEVAETAQERGIALQKAFTEYLHQLDDTRPVTCGINIFFNFLNSIGFGVYSDEKARKQAEAAKQAAKDASKKKPKKKAVGSEFFNNLAAMLGTDFMKFGAWLPPCDWKTRDAFAAMDIAGYNYGNWRYKKDARKYPDRLILGSETLIGDAYDFWETAKTLPQLVGDFVWAGWDYIGECGLGGPEFERFMTEAPEDKIRGGTCRIDVTGKLTSEADYTRVAFELVKGPVLAVNPPFAGERKPKLTGWQLTRAMNSWSWQGCEGNSTTVEVYARAASVELLVNDKSLGRKKPRKGRALFNTVYTPGTLTAVAYDASGRETGHSALETAGEETQLRLNQETRRCHPGEIVFLRARYTDGDDILKPLEKGMIAVSAENAEVIGTANANTYFQGNYAQSQCPAYLGEAQIVVRAKAPGLVRVRADDGFHVATAAIICEE